MIESSLSADTRLRQEGRSTVACAPQSRICDERRVAKIPHSSVRGSVTLRNVDDLCRTGTNKATSRQGSVRLCFLQTWFVYPQVPLAFTSPTVVIILCIDVMSSVVKEYMCVYTLLVPLARNDPRARIKKVVDLSSPS